MHGLGKQGDDLEWFSALATEERVSLVELRDQPCPARG